MAGPIEMPAEVAALVALDEVVVHGWDLARSTGQRFEADDAAAAACLGFAESFEVPADDDGAVRPTGPRPGRRRRARPADRRHRTRPLLDPVSDFGRSDRLRYPSRRWRVRAA